MRHCWLMRMLQNPLRLPESDSRRLEGGCRSWSIAKVLLDGDDGRGERVGLIVEACAQESSGSGVFLEFGEMIGIKYLHDLQAGVGFRDTPGPSSWLP